MVSDRAMRTMIGLCTVILIAAALRAADTVFAPIAVALFVIALVRPVQRGIQPRAGAAVAACGHNGCAGRVLLPSFDNIDNWD